ncbi:MAG: hypothetical protein COA73_00170 [Candidatus Hydrogenedentota bacterium]|nr:MAG: hypothetical protein COA73_00170 [Candidatus Hydrogenedentota bacterium]
MNKKSAEEIRNLVLVISFALFGLFSFYYWGSPTQKIKESVQLKKEESQKGEDWSELLQRAQQRPIAESYIQAYQTGNCAEITRLTWWMQERLLFLQGQTLPESEVAKAMQEFCAGIQRDHTTAHLLTVEGIADQYLLTPQCTIQILGADRGIEGLAKPTSERVWVRVNYPNQAIALRDGNSKPIKSLVIGLNISHDGYILKSGIRGNIDVDLDRILYWN